MENGKDKKRFFWRIGDKEIAYPHKSHGPRGEVGSPVALVGEANEGLNGFVNLFAHSVGSIQIVLRDVFPKLVKVPVRFGMENIAAHARLLRRASLFSRRRANASSPSMGFTLPLLMSS